MVEVGIILRAGIGGTSLIVARIDDSGLLRQALGQAILAAEQRAEDHNHTDPFASAGAREQARILRGLLAHVGASQMVM
jgi:hypothetical protein